MAWPRCARSQPKPRRPETHVPDLMLRSRPLRPANIRLLASPPNAPECAGGDTDDQARQTVATLSADRRQGLNPYLSTRRPEAGRAGPSKGRRRQLEIGRAHV